MRVTLNPSKEDSSGDVSEEGSSSIKSSAKASDQQKAAGIPLESKPSDSSSGTTSKLHEQVSEDTRYPKGLTEVFTANTNSVNSPFLLELFCGSAGVCAQFRILGGRALGIDHRLKRDRKSVV